MNKIMTHMVGGYPSLEENEALALSMAKVGVSFIEIQIPFSDPVADGPTIMAANTLALNQGITPKDCMKLMSRIKGKVGELPMLFMTYYNIVLAYGLECFCRDAKTAGAYGLIVPDIPPTEESYEGYLKTCEQYGLHAIQIVSPLTSVDRMKEIVRVSSGFIYCVSTTGKTGARQNLDLESLNYLKTLRELTNLPLALGFGISTREHVDQALQVADIAVMGSKVIQTYDQAEPGKRTQAVEDLLKNLID